MSDVSKIVHCKDCIHCPHEDKDMLLSGLRFPDYVCPCQCEDPYYSWMPKPDWFCANGESKQPKEVKQFD